MAASDMIERARKISLLPGFGAARLWLTFYLAAEPANLEEIARHLTSLGATNLDDTKLGWLYPEVPVANDALAMVMLVNQVRDLASASDVTVFGVDVDTSPDVSASLFKELVSFEPSDN